MWPVGTSRERGIQRYRGGLNRRAQPTQGSDLERQMSKQERGLPDLMEVMVKWESYMLTAQMQKPKYVRSGSACCNPSNQEAEAGGRPLV